jgi:hypothetical protein
MRLDEETMAFSMYTTAWLSSGRIFFVSSRRTYSAKCRCSNSLTALSSLRMIDSARSRASQNPRPSHKLGDPAFCRRPRVPPYPKSAASLCIVISGSTLHKSLPSPRVNERQKRMSRRDCLPSRTFSQGRFQTSTWHLDPLRAPLARSSLLHLWNGQATYPSTDFSYKIELKGVQA